LNAFFTLWFWRRGGIGSRERRREEGWRKEADEQGWEIYDGIQEI
jgi:hypothetical protein